MKNCPSCQQVYTDDGPEYCLNDGTPLVRSPSAYNPGAAYGSQWQQPTQGWQPPPQGRGYQPPAPYPPYSYPPAPSGGGGGVATASLITGIGSIMTMGIVFLIVATNRPTREAQAFVGLIGILSILTGLAAIILGIVALSMSSRNPAISKAKGIIGLCLGALPVVIIIIGIIAAVSRSR